MPIITHRQGGPQEEPLKNVDPKQLEIENFLTQLQGDRKLLGLIADPAATKHFPIPGEIPVIGSEKSWSNHRKCSLRLIPARGSLSVQYMRSPGEMADHDITETIRDSAIHMRRDGISADDVKKAVDARKNTLREKLK